MLDYPKIMLKPGRERAIQSRHPWIFSGALKDIPSGLEPGSIVDVVSVTGAVLARGFFNPRSQISVRILSDRSEDIGAAFFSAKIADALSLRLAHYGDTLKDPEGALRLIYAESDGLPGLIVDRYADILVVQMLSAGMKREEKTIVPILIRQFSPRTVYEKSRGGKDEEGIGHADGLLYGEALAGPIVIKEDGLPYYVDITAGQKTGFYLDLREVRKYVRGRSAGRRVLNMCAYTGSISIAALAGGAEHVNSVDSSEPHLKLLEKNLTLGSWDAKRHQSVQADMFDYLHRTKDGYDLIVLDPPAFAQRQKDVDAAVKGYKDLHVAALKHLRKGGELVTLSCSHHMDSAQFDQIIFYALKDLRLNAHIVHRFSQPADHPVSPFFPEGAYFKGLVLRKS